MLEIKCASQFFKNFTKILKFSCTSLFLSFFVFHEFATSAIIKNAKFQDINGSPSSLESHFTLNSQKQILVLFWAQWCGPCVHELQLVASRKDELTNFNIIAISIDAKSEWHKAEMMTNSFSWPFGLLFDDEGLWFHENISTDGSLPQSLILDANFAVKQKLQKIDQKSLTSIINDSYTLSNSQKGMAANFEAEYAHNKKSNSQVIAWTSTFSNNTNMSSSSISHQVLRQKISKSSWTRFEDQLGKSWIERNWHFKDTSQGLSLRIGDQDVHELSGHLISLRSQRATGEFSYLRGGHINATSPHGALKINAGMVSEKLFPNVLDPERDLSNQPPNAKAYSSSFAKPLGENSKLVLAIAKYQEKRRSFLNGKDRNESRYGLGLSASFSNLKLESQGACYNDSLSEDPQGCQKRHSWVGSGIWKHSRENGFATYSELSFLKRQRAGVFTNPNSLYFDPFEPITTDNVILESKLTVGNSTPIFPVQEIILLRSQATEIAGSIARNLYAGKFQAKFNSVFKTIELILGHQRDGTEKVNNQIENLSKINAQFSDFNHTEVLVKIRDTQSIDAGKLYKVSTDFNASLSNHWDASIGGAAVYQSGSYLNESGFAESRLSHWFLASKWKFVQLKLMNGQEPGGVTCTAGSCSWLPPLNGTRASISAGQMF